MTRRLLKSLLFLFLIANLSTANAQKVPSPEEVFGFQVGADYKLADYDQMLDYYDQMSGWAQREDKYLKGKAAMIDVQHGEDNVVLFSFRPQFRGQPRGTYQLIFNAIFEAAGE